MKNVFRTRVSIIMAVCFFISAVGVAAIASAAPTDGGKIKAVGSSKSYAEYFAKEREWVDMSIEYSGEFSVESGNKIVRNSRGKTKVLYEGQISSDSEKDISFLHIGEGLLYFREADTIYRVHVASGSVDKVLTNQKMVNFQPISNYKIEYTELTPQAVVFISKGGTLYDEDQIFRWENTYSYDINTKKIRYVSPEELQARRDAENAKYNAVSKYSTTINGVKLPLAAYPVGVYLNSLGKNKPCTHHTPSNISACDPIAGSCGCQYIGNGIQCTGFAKYTYKTLFGSYSAGPSISNTPTRPATSAEKFFSKLRPGARINSSGHTMIFLAKLSDGIEVYQANYSEPCRVDTRKFTFVECANNFPLTKGYNAPA